MHRNVEGYLKFIVGKFSKKYSETDLLKKRTLEKYVIAPYF